VEIEVVPHAITQAIAERTGLFLISMGAGAAGHAQYLFTDDVPGRNRGRMPRHARRHADFAAELDRLQGLRVEAMTRFAREVHEGMYPAPQYLVDSEAEVVAAFRDWLSDQGRGGGRGAGRDWRARPIPSRAAPGPGGGTAGGSHGRSRPPASPACPRR
jgi:hypothetical protein